MAPQRRLPCAICKILAPQMYFLSLDLKISEPRAVRVPRELSRARVSNFWATSFALCSWRRHPLNKSLNVVGEIR